jgi:hypothetical protein
MDAVLRRLAARRPLTPAEADIVGDLARQRVRERAGNELASASGGVTPRFLLSGWAAHQSVLSDGRRQLYRLVLAGDIFGLQSDIGRPGDQLVALTDVSSSMRRPSSGRRARAICRWSRQPSPKPNETISGSSWIRSCEWGG